MSDEITLTQLTTEMAQLRQQMEIMNQRLDMIYGAVTRLADAKSSLVSPPPSGGAPAQGSQAKGTQLPTANMPLTAAMMMDPSSMLDSLRQYALNAGLDISSETVDRLKSNLPADETKDEPTK